MADVLFILVRTPVKEVYGGEKSTIATANGLLAKGFRSSFLVTARDQLLPLLDEAELPYELVEVPDPIAGIRAATWRGRAAKLRDLFLLNRAVYRQVRDDGVRVVHAAAVPGFFSSWLGGKLAGAQVVFHVRTASRDQKMRWPEELAILLSDRTITVSRSLREQLLGSGHRLLRPILGPKLQAIYNGFDFHEIDAFRAAEPRAACRASTGPGAERVSALLVGSVFVDKGQLRFIERVLPRVVAQVPTLRVTCLGGVKDEAYEAACRASLARLGLTDHFVFGGYLPQQEVYRWYQGADFAVLPSEREGLPRCGVEAHAFGLPMAATAVVGTVEAVKHGETGFLVPNDRIEELAEPMIRLAKDAALRARMGAAAEAHVRANFSLERNVTEIAGVYRELTAAP